MRLLQLVGNTRVLCDIAVGQMPLREQAFRLLIDAPPDDTHLGRISKSVALPGNLVFLVGAMDEIVTRLAERDQIIRTVSACFATFNVMHIQDHVFQGCCKVGNKMRRVGIKKTLSYDMNG
jgi:hypothetical protein